MAVLGTPRDGASIFEHIRALPVRGGDAPARIGERRPLLRIAERGIPAKESGSTTLAKRQVGLTGGGAHACRGSFRKKGRRARCRRARIRADRTEGVLQGRLQGSRIGVPLSEEGAGGCFLLEAGDGPVAAVARSAGFASAGKFGEAFEAACGAAPPGCRRLFRGAGRHGE